MPLPALPSNNTACLFVDYTTGRKEHSFLCRYDGQAGVQEALDACETFLSTLAPVLCNGWAVTGARNRDPGSIVSLPINPGSLGAIVGTSFENLDLALEPYQFTWSGRGEGTGREVRVGIYGITAARPTTYRFTGAGRPQWAIDATADLAASSVAFITVGEDRTVWRQYVNGNFNSYWETEARQ